MAEKEFTNLISEIYNVKKFYESDMITPISKLKDYASRIKTIAIKLNNIIIDVTDFYEKHSYDIYKIHDILVGFTAKIYLDTYHIDILRNSHDYIFQSIFKIKLSNSNLNSKFKNVATNLFSEFIKGITYFSNEKVEERPIYHRISLCGTKLLTVNDKFSFPIINSKKNAIKICYIERLIYDYIFRELMHLQDASHLKELKIMQRLYEDNFNYNSIDIKIDLDKNILLCTIMNKDDDIISREKYAKKNKEVICEKVEGNSKYTKIQTFDEEKPWIKIIAKSA